MDSLEENLYPITLPGHIDELCKSLYQLQQTNNLCDVLILAEDGNIRAHSAILSAVSSVFKQWITNFEKKNADFITIYMKGQSIEDLQNLVKFIYTGCLTLSPMNVHKMLKLLHSVDMMDTIKCLYEDIFPFNKRFGDLCIFDSDGNFNSDLSIPNMSVDVLEQHGQNMYYENETVVSPAMENDGDITNPSFFEKKTNINSNDVYLSVPDSGNFENSDDLQTDNMYSSKDEFGQVIDFTSYQKEMPMHVSVNLNEEKFIKSITNKGVRSKSFLVSEESELFSSKKDDAVSNRDLKSSEPLVSNQNEQLTEEGDSVLTSSCETSYEGHEDFGESENNTSENKNIGKQSKKMKNTRKLASNSRLRKASKQSPNISRKRSEGKAFELNSQSKGLNSDKSRQKESDIQFTCDQPIKREESSNTETNRVDISTIKEENIFRFREKFMKNTKRKEKSSSAEKETSKNKKKKKPERTKCTLCKERFENHKSYLEHRKEKHGNIHHEMNQRKTIYMCDYESCDYQAKNKGFMARHKDLVHGEGIDETKFNVYRCEVEVMEELEQSRLTNLSASFNREEELAIVDNINDKICETCGKKFSKMSNLKRHLQIHSGNDFVCTICDKAFKTKEYMEVHSKRCHELVDHKSYLCSDCGKSYSSISSLYAHARYKHKQSGKPCEICKKEFKDNYARERHMKKHRNEKEMCTRCMGLFKDVKKHALSCKIEKNRTHKCDYCDTLFVEKRYLLAHIKRKHLNPEVHVCNCGKTYSQSYALRRHFKSCLQTKISFLPKE